MRGEEIAAALGADEDQTLGEWDGSRGRRCLQKMVLWL